MSAATAVPAYAGIPLTPGRDRGRQDHPCRRGQPDVGGSWHAGHPRRRDRDRRYRQDADRRPAGRTPRRSRSPGTARRPTSTLWLSTLGTVTADLKAAGVSLLTAHGRAIAVVGEGGQGSVSHFPGSRPSRCSAGGCWCPELRSRRPASATSCGPAARFPSRCRPSRSSRPARRSRWSGRSAAWSLAGISGSPLPRPTLSARSGRSSRSTAWMRGRSPESRSRR